MANSSLDEVDPHLLKRKCSNRPKISLRIEVLLDALLRREEDERSVLL
jgi:hypothetical protein